jgi:hypothetical protein
MGKMNLPIETWRNLFEKEEERSRVPMENLEAEGRAFIAELRARIEKELVVTAVGAQRQADMYWAANKSAREEAGADEQGRAGTRVRIVDSTLVAEWYKNRFIKLQPGGKKKRVFSTYLKKGAALRYPKHYFKEEPQWARAVIELVETRYVLMRQRANVLAKMRRALAEYERLIDKCYSPGEKP